MVCVKHHFSCFPFCSRQTKEKWGKIFSYYLFNGRKGYFGIIIRFGGNGFSPSLLSLKSKCGIFLYCLEFAATHKIRYYILEILAIVKINITSAVCQFVPHFYIMWKHDFRVFKWISNGQSLARYVTNISYKLSYKSIHLTKNIS